MACIIANLIGTLIWFPVSLVYGCIVAVGLVAVFTPFLLCLTIIYLLRVAVNIAAIY